MGVFYIRGVYEYAGNVEGETEEQARQNFFRNLNDFYVSAEDEEIEQAELCWQCDGAIDWSHTSELGVDVWECECGADHCENCLRKPCACDDQGDDE